MKMEHRYPESAAILEHNRRFIPGGAVSVNRATRPEIAFVKGQGAYIWDADVNRYIDYHAAFAPHFPGHNDPHITEAVIRGLRDGASLFGSGTTVLDGRLAELICTHVPSAESVQFLNTGSEATYEAIRLARAATGRNHIVRMQGGYNGWHNDVSCNLMTPLERLGPRRSPGEYPYIPISAGVPAAHQQLVHSVNFNDLASVEHLCERYPIAALITDPVLQNVGIVKPDLVTFGKAVANGYAMAVLGGRKELMDYVVHTDPARRVLLAGTYNAHPIPTLAALGARMQAGLAAIVGKLGLVATASRQGSAFCLYFTDHAPVDWHDLASHHQFELDEEMRRNLIPEGVCCFPLATKQCSISAAHTEEDIDATLQAVARVLPAVCSRRSEQYV